MTAVTPACLARNNPCCWLAGYQGRTTLAQGRRKARWVKFNGQFGSLAGDGPEQQKDKAGQFWLHGFPGAGWQLQHNLWLWKVTSWWDAGQSGKQPRLSGEICPG